MADSVQKRLRSWFAPLKIAAPKIYLVGGAVRDLTLGRPVTDMDLVCDKADETARALATSQNASRFQLSKKPMVPVCYRLVRRSVPDDHIDIVQMQGGTILNDLAHRDFTINAMAIPICQTGRLGEIIDPFGGLSDLQQQYIRVTGPDVLEKDPLRILRAVRFSAELGFTLTHETCRLISLYAEKIDQVAGERIWTELKQILLNQNSAAFIRQLDELGVLTRIFPEIEAMKGCRQNAYHHLDVWPHTMEVLAHCEKIIHTPTDYFTQGAETVKAHLASGHRTALLKLVAMLHDVGKPPTRQVDGATGRITFHGHDQKGARMVGQIARRLRLSQVERTYLETLVATHLRVLFLADAQVKPSTRMRLFRELKENSLSLIIHGMADVLATRGPNASPAFRHTYLSWAKSTVAGFDQSTKPRLSPQNDLVRGKDLLSMGMSPGPEMGKILSQIRQAQDDRHVQNRADAMVMAKKIMSGSSNDDA